MGPVVTGQASVDNCTSFEEVFRLRRFSPAVQNLACLRSTAQVTMKYPQPTSSPTKYDGRTGPKCRCFKGDGGTMRRIGCRKTLSLGKARKVVGIFNWAQKST